MIHFIISAVVTVGAVSLMAGFWLALDALCSPRRT